MINELLITVMVIVFLVLGVTVLRINDKLERIENILTEDYEYCTINDNANDSMNEHTGMGE